VKESSLFTEMLTRAKAAKVSRFSATKGSPRLCAAISLACFDINIVEPLPLPVLKELGAPCGIDTAQLDVAAPPRTQWSEHVPR
jgi:hypothetical protein